MDEKVKLEFVAPKKKKLEYGDVTFELVPFIDAVRQTALIEDYLRVYFKSGLVSDAETDYISAEYNLRHSIFHLLTNVEVESLNTDMYDASDLWEKVKAEIKNYEEFYNRLQRVVLDVKEQGNFEKSLSKTIEHFSAKVAEILENASKLDPGKLAEFQKLALPEKPKSKKAKKGAK